MKPRVYHDAAPRKKHGSHAEVALGRIGCDTYITMVFFTRPRLHKTSGLSRIASSPTPAPVKGDIPFGQRSFAFIEEAMIMTELRLPRSGQCKWAEGTGGNYTFPCSNRVEPGVSYCVEHHALVYIAPEERRRSRALQVP